ncbi:MAG: TIGR00304 family membrane protein [Thermoplasmata archaeon]
MDVRKIIPVIVLLSGIFLVIYGVIEGDAEVALLIFIPVIYGAGIYLTGGVLMIFLSFFLFFVFSFQQVRGRENQKVKPGRTHKESSYGGVIFIGPIPIIFGKDKSIAKKMMYLGLLIALILAAIYFAVILT